MTSIDERVVSMKFQNSGFLNGISSTLSALAKLKQSLDLKGAAKGLDGVNAAASKFPPAGLAAGIEGISAKFSALATIGITALSRITNAAITAGTQLVKSLTIDPVKAGLTEYETNLNSIQTILANTGLEGQKGLDKVNHALEQLNEYSDQTIYNFSEMARNIGTFTAAGVDLDTSTAAIKGIANLAAVSGSNSQQASTAMYQLSQALAAGKVSLQDWNSVVNAGMGGEVFQNALKETARVHGVAVDSIIKEEGSFRDSLQKGWITSEILTETLNKFTGDLNEKQLKSMGYTKEQIADITKMGQVAQDAATKVKTMSQLIGTLQEAAGSGWAKTWQLIFGDFEEARTLFTNVNNVLGALIGASADARNKMLGDWKKLGGRKVIIEAIGNAFNGVLEILKPVQDAFRQIFPPTTGKQLFELTKRLRDFSETIKIGAEDAKNLRRTFAGVFAIFSIAGSVIKGLLTVVGRLFGAFGEGTGSLLDFTGGIGDWLVALDKAIKKSDSFTNFFKNLGNVLAVPIDLLILLGQALANLFGEGVESDSKAFDGALERIGTRLEPFAAMANAVATAWGRMGDVLSSIWNFMAPFATEVSNLLGQIGQAISNAVATGDFSTILDTINTGFFAALVLGIRKFLANGKIFDLGSSGGGFLDGIKEAFGGLNDTLGALQANLKAGTLIKIAAAVALLTASVVALSLIDSGNLTKALTAITVMFVQLGAAMTVFTTIMNTGAALKLAPMAAGLVLLSTSILILAGAVKILSTMSWDELTRGLAGLAGTLLILVGSIKLIAGAGKGLLLSSVGMVALAGAVTILAGAVAIFAQFSWEDLLRGLAGLAGSMTIIAGAMRLMPGAIPGALAMLVVAPALVMLAGALKVMASMSWEEFAKSMSALAGGLLLIAGGLYLMTAALPGAAAMLVVAPALVIMAAALKIMASMSWEDFGKSMAILASSLAIIAITVTAMIAALPGAAALLVVAAALAVLAPVLLLFGGMSWGEIGKGLTVLAASLAIIGIAGAVLTPVIPTLLGLGAAIALIGIGTLAAGAGLLAFALGLTALSVAGAAGTAALVAIVSGLIGLIPMALRAVAEGIVLGAEVIGNAAPTFINAMVKLMLSLLKATDKVAPKIVDTVWKLVLKIADRVADGYPKLVDAGLRMITGILDGIAKNIGKVVTTATTVIVAFINAIGNNLPRVAQAGADLIIKFIDSITASINNNAGRMRSSGQALAFAIVDGMTGGLLSGASRVINSAVSMASGALNAAKRALGIASPSKEFYKIGRFANQGFARGLSGGSKDEVRAATKTMKGLLTDVIRSSSQDIKEAEARLKELTSARNKDTKAILRAQKALEKAQETNRKATSARTTLTKYLANESKYLETLGTRYENLTNRINKAQQGLVDARRTRDDFNKSVRDQIGSLGNIEGKTLKGFTTSFKNRVEITQKFAAKLQELRRLGLNDALYKELLLKGPEALGLVSDIANGGKASVDELNKLSSQLGAASKKLGNTASQELYQAGVDAAQGLVNGLKKRRKEINAQMDRIAAYMVRAIRKKLGIRSPSTEMAKIGVYVVEGLIVGLKKQESKVNDTAREIGDTALSSLGGSLSNLDKLINSNVDMVPVIRPVLDLTAVRNEAKNMPGLTVPVEKFALDSAYATASGISSALVTRPGAPDDSNTVAPVTYVDITQNNTSPESLSTAEIYRQTKNLVSTTKGVLAG